MCDFNFFILASDYIYIFYAQLNSLVYSLICKKVVLQVFLLGWWKQTFFLGFWKECLQIYLNGIFFLGGSGGGKFNLLNNKDWWEIVYYRCLHIMCINKLTICFLQCRDKYIWSITSWLLNLCFIQLKNFLFSLYGIVEVLIVSSPWQ